MGAGLSLQHRLGSEVSLSSVIHCNSFSPIDSGHLPESFNYIFPLPEWNLLEIKIHLLMSVVLTPILYQESCSALGMQRQVSLDPVLLGCLPWSRDLGQKGQKCLRPFKYSGFTSGPFISVKKV